MAAREAGLRIHQGPRTVSDYSIDFQTLATNSGWDKASLYDAFLNGLSEPVKVELLTRGLPEDLNRLMEVAIRVDA